MGAATLGRVVWSDKQSRKDTHIRTHAQVFLNSKTWNEELSAFAKKQLLELTLYAFAIKQTFNVKKLFQLTLLTINFTFTVGLGIIT